MIMIMILNIIVMIAKVAVIVLISIIKLIIQGNVMILMNKATKIYEIKEKYGKQERN